MSLLRTITGQYFGILRFGLFYNYLYTNSSEKVGDSCKDSFISTQEFDSFGNNGLKLVTFWRRAVKRCVYRQHIFSMICGAALSQVSIQHSMPYTFVQFRGEGSTRSEGEAEVWERNETSVVHNLLQSSTPFLKTEKLRLRSLYSSRSQWSNTK